MSKETQKGTYLFLFLKRGQTIRDNIASTFLEEGKQSEII